MVALTEKAKRVADLADLKIVRRCAQGAGRWGENLGVSSRDELRSFLGLARTPRLRTLREFAEDEIVVPTGPFEGRRYRCDRIPFVGALYAAIESADWSTIAVLGPSQSGKTTAMFVIPLVYHLFECRENVICGVPDLDLVKSKWEQDIKPVIERMPNFKALLPKHGQASKGGTPTEITFTNNSVLRFMTGGGGDKSRASITSRVLVVTEVDGFGHSVISHEADKLRQLFARTRAYENARHYLECTVTVEEGHIHQAVSRGTDSRLLLPCPHCGVFVVPGREHLKGWQDAEDEISAYENALFCCPKCGQPWSDEQRVAANAGGRIVHKGQEIDARGRITGETPRTRTLGFRWSAVHNLLRRSGTFGVDCWRADRALDEDNAERELCQFVFAVPYKAADIDITELHAGTLEKRIAKSPKGMVPEDCAKLTMFIDIGKRMAYWLCLASGDEGRSVVTEYGSFEVLSDKIGFERAVTVALREFRDSVVLVGFNCPGEKPRVPDMVLIDAGWQGGQPGRYPIYQFCNDSGAPFLPYVGRGASQTQARKYSHPSKTGARVLQIGEEYYLSALADQRVRLLAANVDHWKGVVHSRLACASDAPGAILLHAALARDHRSLAFHLTAERQVKEFVPGKPETIRWHRVRRTNHWLDCLTGCAVAAHLCGVRVNPAAVTPEPVAVKRKSFTTPDGRPYLVTER